MGYQVVTCNTAVMRIDGFAMMPNFTFGLAIATFVGQNIGANRMDRVNQGTKDVLKMSLATSFVLVALLLLFGKNLIRMFTTTEEIINLGVRQIRILAPGYVAMAISQIYGGIMRGAGDTMPSMWISMFTVVVIRVPSRIFWHGLPEPNLPAGSLTRCSSTRHQLDPGRHHNYLGYAAERGEKIATHEQVEWERFLSDDLLCQKPYPHHPVSKVAQLAPHPIMEMIERRCAFGAV